MGGGAELHAGSKNSKDNEYYFTYIGGIVCAMWNILSQQSTALVFSSALGVQGPWYI